jgi:hypothetical protein
MDGKLKTDIQNLINELIEILKIKEHKDTAEVKNLSNKVIHDASVFQDEDSISIAVFIYSLSKIMDRNNAGINHAKLVNILENALTSLTNNDLIKYRKNIQELFNFIRAIDKRLKLYINELITHAQAKKGCKLCEHGVSVARASEVLGISQWELMHYLGKTTLIDQFSEPVNVLSRLQNARRLFL